MTPLQLCARLERVRESLRRLALASVAVWATGSLALVLLIGVLFRVTTGQPSRALVIASAVVTAMITVAWRWRRARPRDISRLDAAIWVESLAPSLKYSLVTLAEQDRASDADPLHRRLAAFATQTAWERSAAGALRQRRTRVLGRLALAVALIAVAAYPWKLRHLGAEGNSVAALTRMADTPTPAGRVRASVTLLPPGYTNRPTRTLAFGETVSVLAGSVIRVDGEGSLVGTALLVQESSDSGAGTPRSVHRAPQDDGWRGTVRVGFTPIALRLRDVIGERWLLVTPVVDSAPVATLLLPDADTLVFDTTAMIRVSGIAHDDIAVRDARIEYIISSGSGEQFTFKSGALATTRGTSSRDVTLASTLDLGALGLKPGDLMHVRLTAHDGNTLTGPSLGTSETRTIRIPRTDARDSVAVEQLPPTPVDKGVLSQRQLLLLTERLVARIPRIPPPVVLNESNRIGLDQARLRKQLADIVFARLGDNPSGEHAHFAGDGHDHSAADLASQSTPESVLQAADRATGGVSGMLDSHGDETPVVAVNRPLLEAYNAMWDATRALQGGVPRDALEPMRRALAAIQRARSAERIYLRGTPPAAVVDLAKVRLIGTDSAAFEARRALNALPAPERRIAERVLRGIALLIANDGTARDSLRLVRLDALSAAPTLAAALGDALEALDRGRDATSALLRARRLALSPWRQGPGSALWLGAP
ncbi:MAG: hypothetical protein H7305_04570 [Gemmatimonadaceae bacterium]|nr:hypothetical protein [Gemmatimonadaceae bacterium]